MLAHCTIKYFNLFPLKGFLCLSSIKVFLKYIKIFLKHGNCFFGLIRSFSIMENELKELVSVLKNQHIQFKDSDVIIKQRKQGLQEKPPLYLWDLTRSCYISSLRYQGNNIFQFDTRRAGKITGIYLLVFENNLVSIQEVNQKESA